MSDMENRNIKQDLEPNAADATITITRTLAGIVPLVGAPLAEFVNAAFASPISKRRDEWLIYLAEGLKETKTRIDSFDLDDLTNNEQFVSATLQATQIAIRNHQQEKLDALRNALLNVAIVNAPNADQQQILLNYVDQLTAAHLKILKFLSGPIEWVEKHQPTLPLEDTPQLYQVLAFIVPEMNADTDLFALVITDLYNRGLITTSLGGAFQVGIRPRREDRYGLRDAHDPYQHMSSPLGDNFLRFISSPFPDDEKRKKL